MKCKKCGKNMVVLDPNTINASNPPSRWYICKCGNKELETFGEAEAMPKPWIERWEDANKTNKK